MLKIVLLLSGYTVIISSATFVGWEQGIGVAALIGTLHGMVALVKKNGEVVVLQEKKTSKPKGKKSTKPATSASKKDIAKLAGLNKNVFAQFQNNLEGHQISDKTEKKVSAAPVKKTVSKPASVSTGKRANPYQSQAQPERRVPFSETLESEKEDKVSLTPQSKPKRKIPETQRQKPPVPRPTPQSSPQPEGKLPPFPQSQLTELLQGNHEDSDDDLFADIQITLPSEESKTSNSKDSVPAPDFFDEGLGASLKNHDTHDEKVSEAAALLKMARTSFQANAFLEAKVSLDNYFSVLKEINQTPDWEVQYLYAQICLKLGDTESARAFFTRIKENGLETDHPEYAKIIEAITTGLEDHQMHEESVPFLYDLLNYYRHELDRPRMDHTYERIERALEALGDDERLIRVYKNHLEIKRILKDRFGESQLLDTIGNRYYKMGEKELSRKYYEDNLQLKAVLEKVESP